MKLNETVIVNSPVSLSRRKLFSILPAGAAACLGCVGAARCAAQAGGPRPEHSWAEKADMTWEEIFRFAFQRNFIPYMKALAAEIGNEKFIRMLQETTSERARKGMAGRSVAKRDLAAWAAGMRSPSPLYQHALVYEIVEDTAQAFEFRISQCLWAKAFREENAADIGYASICHPDFAVASGFNPKLKLIRTKTLMQGHDCCNHRYVMES
jgi:hypothetical protein